MHGPFYHHFFSLPQHFSSFKLIRCFSSSLSLAPGVFFLLLSIVLTRAQVKTPSASFSFGHLIFQAPNVYRFARVGPEVPAFPVKTFLLFFSFPVFFSKAFPQDFSCPTPFPRFPSTRGKAFISLPPPRSNDELSRPPFFPSPFYIVRSVRHVCFLRPAFFSFLPAPLFFSSQFFQPPEASLIPPIPIENVIFQFLVS